MLPKDSEEAIGSLISGSLPNSSEVMDAKRTTSILRDFLLRLDQAREWVCSISGLNVDIAGFKEELPKAELLALVVKVFDPSFVGRIHIAPVREFRHTDNVMLFLNWCKKIKLRKHFLFETVDLYESKNIPKVIYCIHGLAHFLNKRGMGRGIVVKKGVVFTYAENSLFAGDIKNISMEKYEEIQTHLDSEEEGQVVVTSPTRISEGDASIRTFVQAVAWKCGFHALLTGSDLSVSILKKFIDFDLAGEKAHQVITEQQGEIVGFFKRNSAKEAEKDELLYTIRLLHENLNRLRGIRHTKYPSANDYKQFKRVLYHLIHDYQLIYEIVKSGCELPLRTLFPDNFIGDFHFSKFIARNNSNESVTDKMNEKSAIFTSPNTFTSLNTFSSSTPKNTLINIARSHFFSSHVFRNIVEAYAQTAPFDLNPLEVRDFLVLRGGTSPDRVLLDQAISDEAVRKEILRRAQALIEFIDAKFAFLLNLDLPYYVRMFATHPSFFSDFLEPAISSSGNSVVADLMAYILGSTPIQQERLCRLDGGFTSTDSLDFSDYAPLRDYLAEARRTFGPALCEAQAITNDVNSYFIEHAPVGDLLQVTISVEEINNIILVLRSRTGLMTEEMRRLVSGLEMVQGRKESYRVEVYSRLNESNTNIELETGIADTTGTTSMISTASPTGTADTADRDHIYKEISLVNNEQQPVLPSLTQKFLLNLDNQFSAEIDEQYNLALQTVLRDLKHRAMVLISLSDGRTLDAVLNDPTPTQGIGAFSQSDVYAMRESVREDIALLRSRAIFPPGREHERLIELIASDIVSSKYRLLHREISLNQETTDALFQKGALLDKTLMNLYQYLKDFTKELFTNKTGVIFNRPALPPTRYGTYRVSLETLRGEVYEDLDVSDITVKVACDETVVLRMGVYLGKDRLCGPISVRFDSLLRMQEEGVLGFDLGEVCCLSVGAVIEMINEKYVNY